MKKIFSLFWVVLVVITMFVSISATDAPAVAVNAMLGAKLISKTREDAAAFNFDNMIDGSLPYVNSKEYFCDFRYASLEDAVAGTAPRYNLSGELDKEDSIYLFVMEMKLSRMYNLESVELYAQDTGKTTSIDGFDIWISETGEVGSYIKVASFDHLHCEGKYEVYVDGDTQTNFCRESFVGTKAQYVIFALTESRCPHAEAMQRINPEWVPNAHPEYFRISELVMMGTPEGPEPEVTTVPVVTTVAPVVTNAPVVTTAAPVVTDSPVETTANNVATTDEATSTPAENKGCGSVIAVSTVAFAVLGCVVIVKKKEQ